MKKHDKKFYSRERMNKWRQSKEDAGIKSVTVYLPEDVRQQIDKFRYRSGAANSEIVSVAIRMLAEKLPDFNLINYIETDEIYHFWFNPENEQAGIDGRS